MSTGIAPYRALIVSSARKRGIPPSVLAGVLQTESGFNPQATGVNPGPPRSVDRGIAQINNVAYPQISNAEAYNPQFAIPYAAGILKSHYQTCKTWTGALEAYNSGQCSGDTGYSSKVLAASKKYVALDASPHISSLSGANWSSNRVLSLVLVVFALLLVVLAI